ncbi:rod shape-determining protein MreC [Ancylomarina subtilis]|uniref:Cell shape-determining protein MreC n=1 Tax=Ancylomarina subtilis TaxID=1639035 RepID=A0A4V2FT96_9BACT|nr:rod shape-determining protein MreC [Ancylomarina subtilis]RZT97255.1 rod shape-determining protein MreC [Ancylomarina subtilis]
MKNLLQLIVRFHFTILFLIIELVCFLLIVNNNNYHKTIFLNSNNALSGGIYNKVTSFSDYIRLTEINDQLSKENTQLHNLLSENYKLTADSFFFFEDSLFKQQYVYRSAKVINNSINKQRNYITLNKGRKHGIKPEMGVIANNGVVGIVKSVSDNYSTVLSLLNSRLKISAKIKKNNHHGSLYWDGKDYRRAKLIEIPSHVNINVGDTITTSSFSSVFPEGILIGTADKILPSSGGNFREIIVLLSNDFNQLAYVDVIGDLLKNERLELEKEVEK